MSALSDLVATIWFLAKTGYRFRRALETPRMLKAGATPGLAYYAMVSLWMDMTGVTITRLWERHSFEWFGLLSEYCMKIDRFADTPAGGSQYLADPKLWKRHPRFTPFTQALAERLWSDHLPRATKWELIRALQSYRYSANVSLMQALQAGALADIESVLNHKETTSGAAFGTCVDLLSITHEITDPLRAALRSVFFNWGMCLQITDDLTDLSQDYGKVQNIAASILLGRPQEKLRLEAAGMRSSMLPSLAPEAFAEAHSLFEQYLSRVEASGLEERSIKQMRSVARCLFWMGVTRLSPLIFKSYIKGILRMLGSHKWRTARPETPPIHETQFLTDPDKKA